MDINNKILTDNLINSFKIGSIEYQIIHLTKIITNLQNHFKKHNHDYHNKRSLLKIISRRKRFLNYIKNKDFSLYKRLIIDLNLRK